MHRAETLIAHEERRKIEKEKVKAPLEICAYLKRTLKGGKQRGKRQFRKDEEKQRGRDQIEDGKSKQYAVVPYMKGVTERIQRAFRKQGFALCAKAGYTIRNAVVSPRDQLDNGKQCVVIYDVPVM